MKPNLSSLVLIGSFAVSGLTALGQGRNPGAVVPDNYIVELRPGAVPALIVARHGLIPDFVFDAAVNGFAGFIPAGLVRRLQADPDVVLIVPDREVEAFGEPAGDGGVRQPQVVPAGVERIGAHLAAVRAIQATGVGVAVVDTGLDTSHPDLRVSPSSFSAIRGATAQDDNGHGTHVGGIIAARDDGSDVVGVAPEATLYSVKVLDRSGSGTDATVIAGLNWVAKNYSLVTPNIRVVNMSLGRAGSLVDNPSYEAAVRALQDRGITVVVAAGNTCSADVSGMVPACYPEVMAVASTTALNGVSSYPGFSGIPADTASFFTTDGIGVAISAPGETQEDVGRDGTITSLGILSTKLGGGTTRMSGSSMAAPHVAGVAALVYASCLLQKLDPSPDHIHNKIVYAALGFGAVPWASPTACYTFDGAAEGILSAVEALK